MAAQLGIDWSPQGLRALEVRGKSAPPQLGGFLELPDPFAPAQAEEVGAKLKAQLRSAGVKATAAVAVVARELLLVRDIRYPAVPDEERPSLIQFQTLKEVTLSPDEAVIDFVPLELAWPTGEKRALAFVLRKNQLAALQKLAQAAGLKLEGVLASPLAVAANAQPFLTQAAATVGLLAGGELLVLHQKEIIFTRALDPAEPLALELRRGLAGYASGFPKQPLDELYVAGAELPAELETLVGSLRLPVRWYDPLPAGVGVQFLPALGAVQAAQATRTLPLNFLQPKKNQPKPNKRRFYAIAGGAAAAAVLLLGGGLYWLAAAEQSDEIARLQSQIVDKKKAVSAYGNLDDRFAALSAWAGQEVVILDELYDLAARFPDASGVRIIRAEWSPLAGPLGAVRQPNRPSASQPTASPGAARKAAKPVGKFVFVVEADSPAKLEAFRRELDRGHWSVDLWEKDQNAGNQIRAVVKVFQQEPNEYVAQVQAGTHRTQPGEIRPEGGRPQGRFGGARLPIPSRGGRP